MRHLLTPLATAQTALLLLSTSALPLAAVEIGSDDFTYDDGPIAANNGGVGWAWNNGAADQTNTGGISSWAELGWDDPANQVISSNALVTNGGGSLRQFGADRNNAAVQASGKVFYKVEMTRGAGATWGGLSHMDFGTEKILFGISGVDEATSTIGIQVNNTGENGHTSGTISLNENQTYTLVCVLDFDNDLLGVFVDPDGSDWWTEMGGNSADVTRSFGNKNWSSDVRLAGGGIHTWDNLIVGTSQDDVGLLTKSIDGDSDGDGVDDDIEESGITNPFSNTPTDPCNPDSDGDGLSDGDEISGIANTVDGRPTNPNEADTDMDTFADLLELQYGTDPNNAASNPPALGLIVIDGFRDSLYAPAVAVQTINSGFNFNELDAAYAQIKDGKLCLMITGNLEGNFNKLELFFDTGDAVVSNVFTSAGNDNAGNMDGMTFDTGFTPEYHIILRRGFDGSRNLFDVDIANLATATSNFYGNVFGGSQTGAGATGTGTVNLSPILIAYDDSNTAGITEDGGGSAADQAAATEVATGIELCIDLADLGSPTGAIKIMALLNNSGHDFVSNQALGGLPVGTGNLGGEPGNIDFNTLAGDQFFTVAPPEDSVEISIRSITYQSAGVALVWSSEPDTKYRVEFSDDLADWADEVNDDVSSEGISTSYTDTDATRLANPRGFYRVLKVIPVLP